GVMPYNGTFLAAIHLAGISLPATLGTWREKPVSQWTEDDAYLVLTNSPWVKNARATVLHEQSEFERRDGGNMGRPHGVGFDGMSDNKDANIRTGPLPRTARTLLLRWGSAVAVRAAGVEGPPPVAPAPRSPDYAARRFWAP